MGSVKEHYDKLLASHYSWMAGGADVKIEENRRFFRDLGLQPSRSGIAVDLGAGSGFQSIPLAEIGFKVIAVDLCDKLLKELIRNAKQLQIKVVCDDLLNFYDHCPANIESCVCMGDTLTHLSALEKVRQLCDTVHMALAKEGCFIVTFRDLTQELEGLDRFIPVRSDHQAIFTCFLEHEKTYVTVHDLIYVKHQRQWILKKSAYRKLKIPRKWLRHVLQRTGFEIETDRIDAGLTTIIGRKK